jgi:ABC-type transport system involved in cytochrome c biogenesis permease subunit
MEIVLPIFAGANVLAIGLAVVIRGRYWEQAAKMALSSITLLLLVIYGGGNCDILSCELAVFFIGMPAVLLAASGAILLALIPRKKSQGRV